MDEFETLINPPQAVFEQFANLASITEDWAFQMSDYKFWSTNYDNFWWITVVEKGTLNFVASVSLARWDAEDGPLYSLGSFYCMPKYRGQGVAKPIFQQVIDMAGDNNIGLFGEQQMINKYAQIFGFNKIAEYCHMFSSLDCKDVKIPEKVSNRYHTQIWSDVKHDALFAYDRTICPRDRVKIMSAWFTLADTFTRVALDSSGNVVGYATARLVTKNKISFAPFYAENLEAAVVLLKDLINMIPNWENYANLGFFYPQCNESVMKLLKLFAKDEEQIFSCNAGRRQFTKKFIGSSHQKTYAVSDGSFQFV